MTRPRSMCAEINELANECYSGDELRNEYLFQIYLTLKNASRAVKERRYDLARDTLREALDDAGLVSGTKPMRRKIKRWLRELDYAIDDKEE